MAAINKRIIEIIYQHPISEEDIKKVTCSTQEKDRFINTYIAAISPIIQQYLDSDSKTNRFTARNFTTLMLHLIRARIENIAVEKGLISKS